MNIFVYSDESGVFDPAHNDFFVFGGVMFFDSKERDIASRKFLHAEKIAKSIEHIPNNVELKASRISPKTKAKLYRSLNNVHKFGAIVKEKRVLPQICTDKKSKQRYLDWVYKMSVKAKLNCLARANVLDLSEVENIYFFVDQHTTATDGRYELKESLEQEFKHGMYTNNFTAYKPPICPNLQSVELELCDSEHKVLVRAADVVANRLYYMVNNSNFSKLNSDIFTIFIHP